MKFLGGSFDEDRRKEWAGKKNVPAYSNGGPLPLHMTYDEYKIIKQKYNFPENCPESDHYYELAKYEQRHRLELHKS